MHGALVRGSCALRPGARCLLCLLRHMALRNLASGEWRGDSVTTCNGVVWVDDLIVHKLVRAHSACSGLEGGCQVCLEHLQQAEAVDAYWIELCALARVC